MAGKISVMVVFACYVLVARRSHRRHNFWLAIAAPSRKGAPLRPGDLLMDAAA